MTLLPASPLDSVSDVVAPENHAYRRGGTLEEFQKLLTTCPKDRRLQYAFRLYCPLRADSIRSLRWRDLHLDATPAWGEVDAWHNKGRRRIKFAIRADLVALLRSSAGRPAAAVFPDVLTAADLRDDLARAGVAFSDDDGNRRLDFHAFRRSFIKLGKSAGMTVEDLRHALHHRDVATTRKHYDDDEIDVPMVMAAESLPGLISDSDSGGSKPRSRMKSDALGRTRKKKHT
jgi:integrase